MKSIAIILAAGRGKRMNSETPKQYMPVMGEPLVTYTIRAFEQSMVDEIILVVGVAEVSWVQEHIVNPNGFRKVRYIVEGGMERYDSVYHGLQVIEKTESDLEETVVLVHDGARACISQDIINHSIFTAYNNGACVPAVQVKDTIKESKDGRFIDDTPDRERLWIVQTPQSFKASVLWEANQNMMAKRAQDPHDFMNMRITDDACIVEQFSDQAIAIVEGDYRNIKVTTPEDLILTEAFLRAAGYKEK